MPVNKGKSGDYLVLSLTMIQQFIMGDNRGHYNYREMITGSLATGVTKLGEKGGGGG